MSSSSSGAIPEGALVLGPRASLRALTILMILHGSVGLLMLLVNPPQWLLFALLAAVLVSWLRVRRHPAFGFGNRALVRLTWHAEGPWTLHDASGAQYDDAHLEGDSLVLPGLVVLNFRLADGARRTRALLGDELEPAALAALRARLLLRASRQDGRRG